MVRHRQSGCGLTNPPAGGPQPLKGLRTGHFMHKVAVDVENRSAVRQDLHDVSRPYLVKKSAGLWHKFWTFNLLQGAAGGG